VLAVEYPGYGVYKSESPDAETIKLDSELVLQFLIRHLKYDIKDVILMGRSMGSGPTCALAAENAGLQALVLLSPYTSLKQAVKSYLGTLASLLVRERFENIEVIKRVKCPTLIIHGQADRLLVETHAIQLHENCGGPSKLIMPATMTHNDFEVQSDLIEPLKQFFSESNVLPSLGIGNIQKLKRKFTIPPDSIRKQATPAENERLDRLLKQLELKRGKCATPRFTKQAKKTKQETEVSIINNPLVLIQDASNQVE